MKFLSSQQNSQTPPSEDAPRSRPPPPGHVSLGPESRVFLVTTLWIIFTIAALITSFSARLQVS